MDLYWVPFVLVIVMAIWTALRAEGWADALPAVLVIAAVYYGFVELPGRAKPVTIEFAKSRLQHAEVVGHHLIQGEAIFVWLRPEGEREPIAYGMPWVEKTARDLHRARGEASEGGGTVQLTMSGGSEGGEPSVGYVPPAAPLPKPGT